MASISTTEIAFPAEAATILAATYVAGSCAVGALEMYWNDSDDCVNVIANLEKMRTVIMDFMADKA